MESTTVRWQDDPAHFRPPGTVSRRDFLYVGLVGGVGLSLPQFFQSKAQAAQKFYETREGPAKSVIHIFLPGGMAHQESFDPKPYAPIEYRGPFNPIDTKLPGVQFSELFGNMAQVADKIVVCRSMTHGEAAHDRGTHNMFTGYRPSPAIQFPSMGSVVSHELGPRNNLPPYVCVPGQPNNYAGSGYLSSAYGPFSLGSDPASGDFAVRDLSLADGVDTQRFDKRRTLLEAVDAHFRELEKSDALDAMDTFYQRAYSLISSKEAREAFHIKAEPKEIRDEYGRNAAGQRMLLARRLVEAGVRFVSLTYGGWDHHDRIKNAYPGQARQLDTALATLVRDLDRRGLLASTRDGHDRVRPLAQDQRQRRPRPLAARLQHHPGRRRPQTRARPRNVGLRGGEPRRPATHGREPGHHCLPPDRHRGRQGADGDRRPSDRNRQGREGRAGAAGVMS